MSDVHRKIELQEQDDLRYLIGNARRRAREKIDLALPPIQGEDALRRRVEELVDEYITKTYESACENMTINGLAPPATLVASLLGASGTDGGQQIEEYEPLDSKAHSRAVELSRRQESLLEEIAALKREAPAQAAENWKAALRTGVERDEDALRNSGGADDGRHVRLDVRTRERLDEVERTWGKGIEGLGKLKREMPGTTAKMERAIKAGEYVLAEEKNMTSAV